MQAKPHMTILALVSTAALSTGAFAGTHRGHENDAVAELAKAKVALIEAIGSAEKHTQGRAARAELESGRNGPVYAVEVVVNGKVFDVRVDATDGKVLSSKEDGNDRHGHHKEMN